MHLLLNGIDGSIYVVINRSDASSCPLFAVFRSGVRKKTSGYFGLFGKKLQNFMGIFILRGSLKDKKLPAAFLFYDGKCMLNAGRVVRYINNDFWLLADCL